MRRLLVAAGASALAVFAAPAWADGSAAVCSSGTCAIDAAPSAREVQSSVDAYLATSKPDASLVGGPGQAGYDGGFWIRGGSFLMKINLTLQTRWEGFDWNDSDAEPTPGGDLSGFSLPRATLKFSGDATCSMHYYAELEFGHHGSQFETLANRDSIARGLGLRFPDVTRYPPYQGPLLTQPLLQTGRAADDFGVLREGWIEYETCPQLAVRMGLVKTAATRQLMTPPEMQQFVDISMASAFIGQMMPGYTDRNRDYGVAFHGGLGCDGEWSYLLTITNGDGPIHRNVIDGRTSDDFAYSARINWDIKGHMGYEEGALRQTECGWVASAGAWVHYYADAFTHRPYFKMADRLTYGVDLAFGFGGWSFTGAYNMSTWDDNGPTGAKLFEANSWFAQLGYLFPNTAWEIAAKYGMYKLDPQSTTTDLSATEYGAVLNYYIDGHSNKLSLDASIITVDGTDINFFADEYTGYNATGSSDAVLVRFQWQLAL
jgi:hypothetical protein